MLGIVGIKTICEWSRAMNSWTYVYVNLLSFCNSQRHTFDNQDSTGCVNTLGVSDNAGIIPRILSAGPDKLERAWWGVDLQTSATQVSLGQGLTVLEPTADRDPWSGSAIGFATEERPRASVDGAVLGFFSECGWVAGHHWKFQIKDQKYCKF